MRPTTRAAVTVATLAAFLVAACGGGSTPAPTFGPTAPPTSEATAPPTVAATAPPTVAATPSPPSAICEKAPAGSTVAVAVAVEIKNFAVDPDPVQAKVGDVIGWTNADGVPHTATTDDAGCATDFIATGQTGRLVFNVPGTYVYHCAIHPTQMIGFKVEITG